jgi:predicted transcriptional regulator
MNNSFILDFNLLNEQDLNLQEFLTLLYLNNNLEYKYSFNYLESLERKQFIKINKNNSDEIVIREKGKLFMDFISIDNVKFGSNKKIIKKSDRVINEGIDEFVSEFRNKWKGLKPGSMGSLSACKDKMSKWMYENPSYTQEQILKAVDIYINSLNNHIYLQAADYFIYKKDAHGESSKLSAFIDEIETKSEGWTSQLK